MLRSNDRDGDDEETEGEHDEHADCDLFHVEQHGY